MVKLRTLKILGNVEAAWSRKLAAKVQAEWVEQNPDAEELIQWSIVIGQKYSQELEDKQVKDNPDDRH